MKKKILAGLISIAIVIGIIVFSFGRADKAKSVGSPFVLGADCTMAQTVATNTLNYLTPGTGTTTLTCLTKDVGQIDFNITIVASSTPALRANADLRWRVSYSHSTSSPTDDINTLWYPDTLELNTSATTTTLALKEYRMTFSTTTPHIMATSSGIAGFQQDLVNQKTFSLKNIGALYTRIEFYIPTGSIYNYATTAFGDKPNATSTNAGIHVQAVKVISVPN